MENGSEEIEKLGRWEVERMKKTGKWEVEKMGNKEDKKLESFDSPNLSSSQFHNFWLIEVYPVFIKPICAICVICGYDFN